MSGSFIPDGASADACCHTSSSVLRQKCSGEDRCRSQSCPDRRVPGSTFLGAQLGPAAPEVSLSESPPSLCREVAAGDSLDFLSHSAHTGWLDPGLALPARPQKARSSNSPRSVLQIWLDDVDIIAEVKDDQANTDPDPVQSGDPMRP